MEHFNIQKQMFGAKKFKWLNEESYDFSEKKGMLIKLDFKNEESLIVKVIPITRHVEYSYNVHTSSLAVEGKMMQLVQQKFPNSPSTPALHLFTTVSVDDKCLQFLPMASFNNIFSECYIIVTDYYELGDLHSFIENNDEQYSVAHWKDLIFQTLFYIHKLNSIKINHSDLHFNNILLKQKIQKEEYIYELKDSDGFSNIYKPTGSNLHPVFWDFEISESFSEYLRISNKMIPKKNVPNRFNPYYDPHFFLVSALHYNSLPDEIYDFIYSLYPREYLDDEKQRESSSTIDSNTSDRTEEVFEYEYFTDKYNYEVKNKQQDICPISEGRMLTMYNHNTKILPTALEILSHPFFEEFRMDVTKL